MIEAARSSSSDIETNLNKLWSNLNQLSGARNAKTASAILAASVASNALSLAESETNAASQAKEHWRELSTRAKDAQRELERVESEKIKEVQDCRRRAEKALIRRLEAKREYSLEAAELEALKAYIGVVFDPETEPLDIDGVSELPPSIRMTALEAQMELASAQSKKADEAARAAEATLSSDLVPLSEAASAARLLARDARLASRAARKRASAARARARAAETEAERRAAPGTSWKDYENRTELYHFSECSRNANASTRSNELLFASLQGWNTTAFIPDSSPARPSPTGFPSHHAASYTLRPTSSRTRTLLSHSSTPLYNSI